MAPIDVDLNLFPIHELSPKDDKGSCQVKMHANKYVAEVIHIDGSGRKMEKTGLLHDLNPP